MRKSARGALGLTVLTAMFLVPGASAGADPENPCQRFDPYVQVSLIGGSSYERYRLHIAADGFIKVENSRGVDDCDGSTLQNTQGIVFQGDLGSQWANIDQSGGSFQNTPIGMDLGDGVDWVRVDGTPGRDTFYANHYSNDWQGTVLGLGSGPNVDLLNVENVEFRGYNGNDWLGSTPNLQYNAPTQRSQMLGPPTFSHARIPLVLNGGKGKDRMTGGDAGDTLIGGAGNDKLKGGKGRDLLKGGGGKKNKCNGGPGKDKEKRGC